jgi:hypothetical protein
MQRGNPSSTTTAPFFKSQVINIPPNSRSLALNSEELLLSYFSNTTLFVHDLRSLETEPVQLEFPQELVQIAWRPSDPSAFFVILFDGTLELCSNFPKIEKTNLLSNVRAGKTKSSIFQLFQYISFLIS